MTLDVWPEATCISEARRLVAERLCDVDVPVDHAAIRLLVSELVTNVIRHTPAGRGTLRVRCNGEVLRVEVEDDGPGVPAAPVHPDREQGGGFGLFLVDRLSDRWGVRDRTCVWFEMDARRRCMAASA
jgi:anti-sigma regulatory factor (Ser/Thr protein kinase)